MCGDFLIKKVAGHIWLIGTPLGTISVFSYLVDTGRGFVLFDTGLKRTAGAVLQLLDETGRRQQELSCIVISHSHHDHIGANAEIADATGAALIAHARARNWMIDHERQFREFFARFENMVKIDAAFHDFFFENLGRPWIADKWLQKFPYFIQGDERIQVLESPGHSEDSISVWLAEHRILLCGDAFMGAGVGNGLPHYSDPEAYRATLAAFLALKPKLLLTGHFHPITGRQIGAAVEQSLRMVDHIGSFLQEALRTTRHGYSLKDLTEMICARFGRVLTPKAFITVEAHLRAAKEKNVLEEVNGIWKQQQ